MLIAKQTETGFDVADHTSLLPNTSFGPSGPTVAQIEELGFYQVTIWKQYDHATEKLVPCSPYMEDKQVFTIEVVPKTEEDLLAEEAQQVAMRKTARAEAYRQESDPLFFKAQRGEATMDEWLAKVQEIKDRF
jgi:hypothetical protein